LVFAPGGASLQNKLFGLFDNSFVGGRIRISIEADEKVTGVSLNDSTQNMVVILRKGMAIYDDSIARWLGAGFETAMSLMQVRAKPGKLWMPYFDWLSRTERLQHEAFICSYGVDIEKMVLNVDWLLQTPLLLPRSIETQKAMAAGLDCLQREVQLLQAQMEALNKQKRGLMQKLLTGEWRVPVREGDVDAMAARVTEEAAQ
jgi:hypothetical protein